MQSIAVGYAQRKGLVPTLFIFTAKQLCLQVSCCAAARLILGAFLLLQALQALWTLDLRPRKRRTRQSYESL